VKFNLDTAELFVPDDLPVNQALMRTTHVCIAAHQDDIEIMAPQPILECYQSSDRWFTGVVVTDGRGSPRDGLYANYSDEEMRLVRLKEQRKAAFVGEYAALVMLGYPSQEVKDSRNRTIIADIAEVILATRPEVVFTHNLADKHATHVGVAVKVIEAIRSLPVSAHPDYLYGCEVWRGLDWLMDDEKVVFDCSVQSNLQVSLIGIFDSQVSGGKRYDLATMGRRVANATYYASHNVDDASGMTFSMDLTPLIRNPDSSLQDYVAERIDRFAQDVSGLITSVSQK
jgi:LmbE family N-acetylglucosaminyl deacetylase